MKLQKRTSRVVGDSVYVKWVITIPPGQIEQLQWKEGDELVSEVRDENLVLEKSDLPTESKGNKMSYDEFKSRIADLLATEPDGLSWGEIKERLALPQRVPNNLWVRMMERDISLTRVRNNKTGKTLWRLKPNVGSSAS